MSESTPFQKVLAWIGLAIIGVALVAWLSLLGSAPESKDSAELASGSPASRSAAERAPAAAPDTTAQPAASAGRLASGQALIVQRAAFAGLEQWSAEITLGFEANPGDELSGRVLPRDGARPPHPISVSVLASEGAAQAPKDAQRSGVARVELPSAWLEPGEYVVEIKTNERSHFPLRRYALEVR